MLDKSIFGGSWESVISRDDYEIDYSPSPRGSPLKDTSNIQEDSYCISRHNPNKTFRRESVIASWKSLKKEREQALGKRIIYVDADNYEDYYGRNKVKRCKSERVANVPRIQKKVKRTYSVLYRYDPNEEKVVKEYKYQLPKDPEEPDFPIQRSVSEPFLRAETRTTKKKVKRSFTTLLNIKTKFLNIFSSKS
ncbi:uncharacterized protein LOC126377911 [Pectinophora gossypiella]|uniref:uncharacterized protein LOC126377911 n=1 Tax=Pectinophora gossypiella TaxID=13191 RepID=UPI00214F5E48|nr:uncharacterized protein LOC126377911 [Pectinophora gossypiella]